MKYGFFICTFLLATAAVAQRIHTTRSKAKTVELTLQDVADTVYLRQSDLNKPFIITKTLQFMAKTNTAKTESVSIDILNANNGSIIVKPLNNSIIMLPEDQFFSTTSIQTTSVWLVYGVLNLLITPSAAATDKHVFIVKTNDNRHVYDLLVHIVKDEKADSDGSATESKNKIENTSGVSSTQLPTNGTIAKPADSDNKPPAPQITQSLTSSKESSTKVQGTSQKQRLRNSAEAKIDEKNNKNKGDDTSSQKEDNGIQIFETPETPLKVYYNKDKNGEEQDTVQIKLLKRKGDIKTADTLTFVYEPFSFPNQSLKINDSIQAVVWDTTTRMATVVFLYRSVSAPT